VRKTPKHKLYQDAEVMFVEHGYTCNAIAEALGISEVSLSRWRNIMAWDKKRDEYLCSPYKIREVLMKELASIAEGNKAKINADSLSKIQRVFQAFEKSSSSIPVILSVFKAFDNWMADNDPQTAILFTEWHKKYLHHVANLQAE